MPAETWYILEDGTVADPRDVRGDAAGILRHRDGRAVAYAPHGPRSRCVDPDEERAGARSLEPAPAPPVGDDREMKPARTSRRYRTRAT